MPLPPLPTEVWLAIIAGVVGIIMKMIDNTNKAVAATKQAVVTSTTEAKTAAQDAATKASEVQAAIDAHNKTKETKLDTICETTAHTNKLVNGEKLILLESCSRMSNHIYELTKAHDDKLIAQFYDRTYHEHKRKHHLIEANYSKP